jgi:hypothetical protein
VNLGPAPASHNSNGVVADDRDFEGAKDRKGCNHETGDKSQSICNPGPWSASGGHPLVNIQYTVTLCTRRDSLDLTRAVVPLKKLKILVVLVGRDRGECRTEEPRQLGAVLHNGRVFDMRGMLPHSEARMRMCVMQVGKRGRWTYRDWIRWRFLWKFFPWYARELRYRGDFCIGQGCMHWFWEDAEKKERGYCSVAVSRTQNMIWARELEEHDKQEIHDPYLRAASQAQRATRGHSPGQKSSIRLGAEGLSARNEPKLIGGNIQT